MDFNSTETGIWFHLNLNELAQETGKYALSAISETLDFARALSAVDALDARPAREGRQDLRGIQEMLDGATWYRR